MYETNPDINVKNTVFDTYTNNLILNNYDYNFQNRFNTLNEHLIYILIMLTSEDLNKYDNKNK